MTSRKAFEDVFAIVLRVVRQKVRKDYTTTFRLRVKRLHHAQSVASFTPVAASL